MPESTELSFSDLRKNRGAAELSSDQTKASSNGSSNGNGAHFNNKGGRTSTQERPLATRPAAQTRALQRPGAFEFDAAQNEAEGTMKLPFDPMRLLEALLRNLWVCILI